MELPTLVYVPCFSGAAWSTDRLTALAGYPSLSPALPEGVDDIERYADALAADVAGLDRYVLVGDSFGANIALALAVRQPEGLTGLVMSGGFAANPLSSALSKNVMLAMARLHGAAYRHLVLRVHAHRLSSPHDFEGQVPWSKADSRKLFLENTPAESFGARVRAVVAADYTEQLSRVNVPTLILTPSHDTLIGDDAARVLREGIPHAREQVLERTGHMFRFSHPETYARAVAEFVSRESL